MAFDKSTLDTLITNLETGEADLVTKTTANVAAQTAAAQAASDLANSQAVNKSNVGAIKDFVSNLDADGNSPAPAPPAPAAPVADPNAPPAAGTTDPAAPAATA